MVVKARYPGQFWVIFLGHCRPKSRSPPALMDQTGSKRKDKWLLLLLLSLLPFLHHFGGLQCTWDVNLSPCCSVPTANRVLSFFSRNVHR